MTVLCFPQAHSISSKIGLFSFFRTYTDIVEFDLMLLGSRIGRDISIREILFGYSLFGSTVVGQGRELVKFPVMGETLEECVSYDTREQMLCSAVQFGKYVSRISNAPVTIYLKPGVPSHLVPILDLALLRIDPDFISSLEFVHCPYR